MKTLTLIQNNVRTDKAKNAFIGIASIVVIAAIANTFFHVTHPAVEWMVKGPLYALFIGFICMTGPILNIMASELPANDYETKRDMRSIATFFNTFFGMFVAGQITLKLFNIPVSHFPMPLLSIPTYLAFAWLIGMFYSSAVEKLLKFDVLRFKEASKGILIIGITLFAIYYFGFKEDILPIAIFASMILPFGFIYLTGNSKRFYRWINNKPSETKALEMKQIEMQNRLNKQYQTWLKGILITIIIFISSVIALAHDSDSFALLFAAALVSGIITAALIQASHLNEKDMNERMNYLDQSLQKSKKALINLVQSIDILHKENIDAATFESSREKEKQEILRIEGLIGETKREQAEFKACEINSFVRYIFGKKIGERIENIK